MSKEPLRTGRILRPVKEMEEERRQRARERAAKLEELRVEGCPNLEDPEILEDWLAQKAIEDERVHLETSEMIRSFEQAERDLERIRENRPLGVPPPIEPRSVHSSIPQPPWKRKLRP
jgi:hypothetical protein